MTPRIPEGEALAAQLQMLTERLASLEAQVRGLAESQKVEAREFVVKDDSGAIRARLGVRDSAPRLTFYDPHGQEHISIGLRVDGWPTIRVEQYDLVQRDAGTDK